MSTDLSTIVEDLVKASPPGELFDVEKSLLSIVQKDNKSAVTKAVNNFIGTKGLAVDGGLIASELNKDPYSSKYYDHIGRKKFNVDLSSQTAIDIEDFVPNVTYPDVFNQLVEALAVYGEDHFPSQFVYTVIPNAEMGIDIILIGEKQSQANFYTGRWNSVYSLDNKGNIQGSISLDIHYYEDGNVRLEFEESAENVSLGDITVSKIVNYISNSENRASLKIMDDFSSLNQKCFKNLRRLLPVTKSKINWGKAIGTYRLGSEVVNNK